MEAWTAACGVGAGLLSGAVAGACGALLPGFSELPVALPAGWLQGLAAAVLALEAAGFLWGAARDVLRGCTFRGRPSWGGEGVGARAGEKAALGGQGYVESQRRARVSGVVILQALARSAALPTASAVSNAALASAAGALHAGALKAGLGLLCVATLASAVSAGLVGLRESLGATLGAGAAAGPSLALRLIEGAKSVVLLHATFLAGLELGRLELWDTRFGPDHQASYCLAVAGNLLADMLLSGALGDPGSALLGAFLFALVLEQEAEALRPYALRSATLAAMVVSLAGAASLAFRASALRAGGKRA